MNFDGYFRFTSYAVVACGALALLASDGISTLVISIFALTAITAWRFEGTKWQISERFGLVLIVLALPLYYLDWQYQAALLARERAGAATLAHLILGLSVIKLFQIKVDRDWVFLYLISFFEVLLAAGLSISPLFLGSLFLYLLFAVCTIIAFEIRKAGRGVKIIAIADAPNANQKSGLGWRLPVTATAILLAISLFAVPLFFMMPRVGGAGFGGGGGGGLSGFVGFSESVELGAIGRLQQNNEVVMRVRVEAESPASLKDLRWRGAALDFFDNKGWRNTLKDERKPAMADAAGRFQFEPVDKVASPLLQTIYLEPIDTPVLFGAPRIMAIQGNFPILQRDENESVTLPRSSERVVYKVLSNTAAPDPKILRSDRKPYQNFDKFYLQLPSIDQRIPALASEIIKNANAKNRYDAARAIETHLQTQFGYTLDLKAGGSEPLADFLFNIREGHCEYFATAMAVMLRTQGIATRIVNGFQTGEYNDAAGAFIVTQKEAHSWVEVYFPESEAWVTFDPTPAAGKNLSERANAGNYLTGQLTKYIEALNMFWLQYVVAYDNQEQRSLARSFRETLVSSQTSVTNFWQIWRERVKDWWENLNGERGAAASWQTIWQTALAILLTVGAAAGLWFFGRRVSWQQIWRLFEFGRQNNARRTIEFYERMTKALAKQGWRREPAQTPLEFAAAVGATEALQITNAYNRVRFGAKNLTPDEANALEIWLQDLERNKRE